MKFRITENLIAIVLLFAILALSISVAAEDKPNEALSLNQTSSTLNLKNYIEYLNGNSDNKCGTDSFTVAADNYDAGISKIVKTAKFDGKNAIVTDEESEVYWKIAIKDAGFYNISFEYRTLSDSLSALQRNFTIDGVLPFSEARGIYFGKIFSCDGNTDYDIQGNQIRADESEKHINQIFTLYDRGGYSEENFKFFLTEGEHTIGLSGGVGDIAIFSVSVNTVEVVSDYSNDKVVNSNSKTAKKIQAEDYLYKSDSGILTVNDRSSVDTEPSSPIKMVYNTIGGDSWSDVGQWIEWQVDVDKDGYYCLGVRFKQNTKIGGISSRSLTIDGKLPFNEAGRLSFEYDNGWQNKYLGGSKPYYFHLTKGSHTIRLTANCGDMAHNLFVANELLSRLNSIYLDIVMVAGATPDQNRDYNFSAQIPDTISNMKTVAGELNKLSDDIKKVSGGSQKTTELQRTVEVLEEMYSDAESIAKRLSNFQSDISALATWISDVKRQPLQIDYITVAAPGVELDSNESGFFKSLSFKIKQLIGTYIMDYSSIGSTSEIDEGKSALKAWMICGTEQAQIIQHLINESFIPEYQIPVLAHNVASTALMPAILSGNGPDAVLQLDETTPVNYALRGAICNLRKFPDIDSVLSQFNKCTYESFELNDGLYALPNTVDYPVLFYRQDIINQLEINTSDFETWEKVLQVVLPKLQTKNLYFGLTPSMQSYLSFYYQIGGELYSKDRTKITLSSADAVNAFKMYSGIYTKYKQKLSFSFVNLFRSGEMPIAVMPISQYYQLAVFAPEIEHLWSISTVPGTVDSNGKMNNSAACTVTGCAILSKTEMASEAWEFLKWWASAKTQISYARNVETVLGIAGRVSPASNEARDSIAWTKEVKNTLKIQLDNCRGVPQVPGSYYATRYFDFAFRDVVYTGRDIFQTLYSAGESINEEIKEKSRELVK